MSAKPTTRDWRMRVQDILDSIAKIQSYTAGMSQEQFIADPRTVDAVIRNFEIIGEAAGYIPVEMQERYPSLAWLEMRGMRNILIHGYFGISIAIVWQTITQDLPSLAAGLKTMLAESSGD